MPEVADGVGVGVGAGVVVAGGEEVEVAGSVVACAAHVEGGPAGNGTKSMPP